MELVHDDHYYFRMRNSLMRFPAFISSRQIATMPSTPGMPDQHLSWIDRSPDG
jgi:hypothetical protein